MLPTFIIIGAQKSGTTFVQAILRAHPRIFIPASEIPFFEDPDYGSSDISVLERRYDGVPAHLSLGFKRANLLSKPECPARIAKHIPAAKLIAVLRNPVDRAISAYYHKMRHGVIPLNDINKGLEQLLDEQDSRGEDILEYGNYATHIGRYYNHFEADQLFIRAQDDIVQDAPAFFRAIFDFLEVPSPDDSKHMDQVRNPGVYSPFRLKVNRLANRLRFEYNEDRSRLYNRDNLSLYQRFLVLSLLAFDKALAVSLPSAKPYIDPDIKYRLLSYYRVQIEETERLTGLDLSAWKLVTAQSL